MLIFMYNINYFKKSHDIKYSGRDLIIILI